MILREPLETESTEPITEQDNELLAKHKEYRYMSEKMTWDPHCYECKVRYRDPKAKDLVMYLHAWRYKVKSNVFYGNTKGRNKKSDRKKYLCFPERFGDSIKEKIWFLHLTVIIAMARG